MIKRLALLTIILATMIPFISCSGNHTSRKIPKTTLLILKTMDNPFFKEIQRGVSENWDQALGNLAMRAGSKEGDITSQRRILDDFINQSVAGKQEPTLLAVLLTPSGSKNELTAQIKSLRDRNIPVILIDTAIDSAALKSAKTNITSFIGSSNFDGGKMAAKVIKEYLQPGDHILLLNGVDGQETAEARRKGFISAINADTNMAGVEIIERTCNWRRDEARSMISALLTMGQKIDAIFAANDEMALGAALALKQNHSDTLPIVGFDAIPEAIEAVNGGKLTATIAQDPYSMGKTAVLTLQKILNKQPAPKNQAIPTKIIKK